MQKQPPNCPKCGEPLEEYTETTTGIMGVTHLSWCAPVAGYIEDEDAGYQDDGTSYYECTHCGEEIPNPQWSE